MWQMASPPVLSLIVLLPLFGCDGGKDTEEQTDTNNSPVANAGPDLEVTSDDDITLDGSASYDPDGDPITFHWSFNRVPAESVLESETAFPSNNTATKTTMFRPDVPGTYIVDLFVEDALGKQSAVDSVVISVSPGEDPVANAGPDLEGIVAKPVSLDGSGSYDPLGRELSYEWALASAPANSALSTVENASQAVTSLTPDVGGRFVVSLTVENGMSSSQPDSAYIDVSSADPEPPVADAGEDASGQDCSEVPLDGSGSFDPNGDILSYEWTLQDKPAESSSGNSSITDRNAEITTFNADISGTYVFSLAVKDNDGWSQPDLVTMQVSERNYNNNPVVEAGSSLAMDGGTAVCQEQGYTYDCEPCAAANLTIGTDALVSDLDDDPVSLMWTFKGEADASILSPTDLSTTVQVAGATPLEPLSCTDTVYTFELTGTDCPGAIDQDTMTVTVTCCGINPPDSGR